MQTNRPIHKINLYSRRKGLGVRDRALWLNYPSHNVTQSLVTQTQVNAEWWSSLVWVWLEDIASRNKVEEWSGKIPDINVKAPTGTHTCTRTHARCTHTHTNTHGKLHTRLVENVSGHYIDVHFIIDSVGLSWLSWSQSNTRCPCQMYAASRPSHVSSTQKREKS